MRNQQYGWQCWRKSEQTEKSSFPFHWRERETAAACGSRGERGARHIRGAPTRRPLAPSQRISACRRISGEEVVEEEVIQWSVSFPIRTLTNCFIASARAIITASGIAPTDPRRKTCSARASWRQSIYRVA